MICSVSQKLATLPLESAPLEKNLVPVRNLDLREIRDQVKDFWKYTKKNPQTINKKKIRQIKITSIDQKTYAIDVASINKNTAMNNLHYE